jgi:hypothetical protein
VERPTLRKEQGVTWWVLLPCPPNPRRAYASACTCLWLTSSVGVCTNLREMGPLWLKHLPIRVGVIVGVLLRLLLPVDILVRVLLLPILVPELLLPPWRLLLLLLLLLLSLLLLLLLLLLQLL